MSLYTPEEVIALSEAHYWNSLAAIVDLVAIHGEDKVISDLYRVIDSVPRTPEGSDSK